LGKDAILQVIEKEIVMARVRIASVGKATGQKQSKSAIQKRYVHGPKGKPLELFGIESNNDNFEDDLTRVFSLNIARVRKDNTAIFGSPDGLKGPVKIKKN
jgi:hypothetical protein